MHACRQAYTQQARIYAGQHARLQARTHACRHASLYLCKLEAGKHASTQARLDSQNSRHTAKATFSPLRRCWGEWRRDGPTYTL
eukprot:1476995-Pleurochrysis_carterae.AAC.1